MFARRLLAVAALVAACSAAPVAPTTSPGPSASGSGAASGGNDTSAPSELANLPELALGNVATQTPNARGAIVGPAGANISATATDGTTFRLAIPPGAIAKSTQVSLYPVASLTGLPPGAALTAGVQFAPDGLQLSVPATLSITLPPDAPASLIGFTWLGNAQDLHPYPALLANGVATLLVAHFSGTGVGTPPNPPIQPLGCSDQSDMATLTANDLMALEAGGLTNQVRAAFTSDLKQCYQNVVKPAIVTFSNLTLEAASGDSYSRYVDAWRAAELGYLLWRAVIADVQATVPTFTVSPEVDASSALFATALRTWYDEWNLNCTLLGSRDAVDAVSFAAMAISVAHADAPIFHLDTKAHHLDYETLLNDLCVQLVIDSSRNFSASKPGDSGTVTVPVGYTISGGPVRHDEKIDVRLTLAGDSSPFADGRAPDDGNDTATLTWPDGVDPVKIDVLASFEDVLGSNIINQIARFDEITKASGKQVTVTAPTGAWSGERWPVVWPTCIRQFLAVDDGEDWQFSVGGASIVAVSGDSVTFIGSGEGVASVSGRSPSFGAATYSGYMSPLAGTYANADRSLQILLQSHLDQEGVLTWDVRPIGIVAPDWTGLTANEGELSGSNSAGEALDITISGGQLAGTVDGQQVTLPKECQ